LVESNSKSSMVFHTENEKNSQDHSEENNIIDSKTEMPKGGEKHETLTRTIRVICLSRFLLLLLHPRQIRNARCTRIRSSARN